MKLGILSDAHGNAVGTRACLEALAASGAEEIVFLGDACGYLPDADVVHSLLSDAGAHLLLGNHEAMLLGLLPVEPERESVYQLESARLRLGSAALAAMRARVPFRSWTIDGRRILCVHGSPWNPLAGYVYPEADLEGFDTLPWDAVFMGHTHRSFSRRRGGRAVVNAGSCGLPRDVGHLASCAIYDTASGECELLRVPFDAEAIIRRHGGLHASVAACLRRTGAERGSDPLAGAP
jgi:predicted phosphodiesterase